METATAFNGRRRLLQVSEHSAVGFSFLRSPWTLCPFCSVPPDAQTDSGMVEPLFLFCTAQQEGDLALGQANLELNSGSATSKLCDCEKVV